MKTQLIFFKSELNIDNYYRIKINPNSSILEYFIADQIIAGRRIKRIKGNKNDYNKLTTQLELKEYQITFPEEVRFIEEFGIVKERFNNWTTQKYLDAFEQVTSITICNKDKSEHILKWFKFLESRASCLKKIIIQKIRKEYKNCFEGAINVWDQDQIRDSFPIINNDEEVLNLLSDINIDIYNEQTFNHETMDNQIYSIRAKCPWDIEHGIEFEIKLKETEHCD